MATSQVPTQHDGDKAKLGLAVTLVAALAGFYTLSKQVNWLSGVSLVSLRLSLYFC
jgi:hypothetical protein